MVSINDKLLLIGSFNDEYRTNDIRMSKTLFEFNTTNESWNKLVDIDQEPWFHEAETVNF